MDPTTARTAAPTTSSIITRKRGRLLKAAYFAVLAMDDVPSVRTIGEMVRRITSKGIRLETVRTWLASEGKEIARNYRDTLGIQLEYSLDTPIKHENGQSGYTPDTPRTPSRARSLSNINKYLNNDARTRDADAEKANEGADAYRREKAAEESAMAELWAAALSVLERKYAKPGFEAWLKPLRIVAFNDSELVLEAETGFAQDWAQEHFQDGIKEALRFITGADFTLRFVVAQPLEKKAQQ